MITVLIPLYNGIEYLKEAVMSVHLQIYTEWTCIIGVNGHGETGGTVFQQATAIVSSLNDPRFSVINLPEVRGAPDAINALVARSTTPWVAHLDADDNWHPMKLHCQVNTLQINPIMYHWNESSGLDTSIPYAGFGARQVKEVIPEASIMGPDGTYGLNDRAIMAAMVNAIKELKAEIDTLKAQLEAK